MKWIYTNIRDDGFIINYEKHMHLISNLNSKIHMLINETNENDLLFIIYNNVRIKLEYFSNIWNEMIL